MKVKPHNCLFKWVKPFRGRTPTLLVDKEKAHPIGVWLVATGRKLGRKGGQRRSGRRHTAK